MKLLKSGEALILENNYILLINNEILTSVNEAHMFFDKMIQEIDLETVLYETYYDNYNYGGFIIAEKIR